RRSLSSGLRATSRKRSRSRRKWPGSCRRRGGNQTNGRRRTMARPATGQIVERPGTRGTRFGLRFRAYGKRQYVTADATTRQEAELELQNVLADVRRGIWRAPTPTEPEAPKAEPTFHILASEWLEGRRRGVEDRTVEHWQWA